ncbi:MAG: myxococcus cysteine-rich repeat containing protein [Myxococcota bacterium]
MSWATLVALSWAGLSSSSAAAARDPLTVQGLELASGAVMAPAPGVVWGSVQAQPGPAERRLVSLRHEVPGAWIAWDRAREAPGGIITAGLPTPGVMESAAVAETWARDWLARHVDVLAPGSDADDFELVSNTVSAGIRSVGFVQRHDGIVVLGGQLSLRFKADSLVYAASQALPRVELAPATGPVISTEEAVTRARAWIDDDFAPATLDSTPGDRVVLPVWDGVRFRYHEVVTVVVDATQPLGSWTVYLDAHTGEPVARQQRMSTAGTVQFDVPTRYPGVPRYNAVAPDLFVTEGGNPTVTNGAGEFTLSADPTTLGTSVQGSFVDVDNGPGAEVTASFPIADGETVVWSEAGNGEFADAQLTAYIHANIAKEYVRGIDPTFGWLDDSMDVSVNLEGSCNAASDGDSLYFLRASGDCQNTARLADVVYHEAGHSVHHQSLIPGVGTFNSPLSEGVSDYLAATIVEDSGMGRGFFYNDDALRELDPPDYEWHWPEDIGTVHETGRIIGGTLWDLRTSLMAIMGDEAGRDHVDHIYYEATRRAVDIPSMYAETLIYDDDDGNLLNGTPNGCEINAAFEAHGLLDPGQLGGSTVELVPVDGGREVRLNLEAISFPGCPVGIDTAELSWRQRGSEEINAAPMTDMAGTWVALIPSQEAGVVVEYQVSFGYTNGFQSLLPSNPADPWYQTFFGVALPIYCLDAEADQSEWTFEDPSGSWDFGPLMGGGVDPTEPYDDDGVLLSQDGLYAPDSNTRAIGPTIDVAGFDDVRLHYRRWLTVEDAFFDQATLYANGQELWQNLETESHTTHHLDAEWRFHDLPLQDFIVDDQIQLAFELDSDAGLHFGGWTVDALCVVQVAEPACGDGIVSDGEECDDGNTEDGDGCDAECTSESEPPPGGTGEEGGDTSEGGGEEGAADETAGPLTSGGDAGDGSGTGGSTGEGPASADGGVGGCGCTSGSGGGPLGVGWFSLLVLGWLHRRR